MRFSVLSLMLLSYFPLTIPGQLLQPPRNFFPDEDEDEPTEIDQENEETNSTEKGMYVGAPCEFTCNAKLHHVFCNPVSGECECEKKYPVKLNPYTGCSKPRGLGEICYYKEACRYSDQHSSCIQIHHNAICQCETGFHSVALQKPSKRIFCAEDLVAMTTDFTTFAGVLSGIAILTGLICFVLHLFNQNLYGSNRRRRHRFGNANLAPPILFSSDAEMGLLLDFGSLPLPIIDRSLTSASRTSSRRTLASIQSRRASSAQGCRAGVSVVSSSRTGSRRPSITSIHSGSSIRSYSARRYEKERLEKEERERERRLGRFSASSSRDKVAPSPSPHSTDDLLPTLEEDKQNESSSWPTVYYVPPLAIREESSSSFQEETPSTSKQYT
ncbi:uncharacterized protein LOC123677041 isoform X1 [Harmonia axyridis]|uniref:uncharacterized protein LOC123677041 isoform X1 n=1 Tax=Harmonia axyridis TaxID=115357 RepID=UPI001E2795E1|nr:uncharacterized protein LOC123677041 isoform X1 [Harmonia axyridis]XP_045469410.1 uncharacterized protein LOC123677041 isoform X1 [Harmonia axyridis]